MRSFISAILLLFAVNASAAALSTNEVYQLNNMFGYLPHKVQLGTKISALETLMLSPNGEGLYAGRIARAVFDPSGVTAERTVAAHDLEVTLPAKAIIHKSWIYVKTQLVDAGAGTLALHCEDADNIFAAADFTGNAAGAIVAGVSTGVAADMKIVDAACNITATVGGAALTAGKLDIFVEYVIAE